MEGGGGGSAGEQPKPKPADTSAASSPSPPPPGGPGGAGTMSLAAIITTATTEITKDGQNPMMNEVILKRFFELSSPEQLANYRLVSKRWYQLSLPAWLQNGPTITLQDGLLLDFLQEAHLLNSAWAAGHEDIVGIRQHRKVRLVAYHQVYHSPSQQFDAFWNEVGSWLTHLTLQNFKIPDGLSFRNIMFSKYSPNLEHLVVDIWSVEESLEPRLLKYGIPKEHKNLRTLKFDVAVGKYYSAIRPFQFDWKALFTYYPNLEHFGVGEQLSVTHMEEILNALRDVRREGKKYLPLKSFIWFFNRCYKGCRGEDYPLVCSLEPVPQLLREAELLALESFRFGLNGSEPAQLVHDMLSLYAKSLKKLEFYRFRGDVILSPFPVIMDQLQSLELTGFPLDHIQFFKEFPNLRSLCLWASPPDLLEETFEEGLISETVEAIIPPAAAELKAGQPPPPPPFPFLTEFCCNYKIDWVASDFAGLLKLAPNLSRLGMHLSNRNFPLVCQYLPHLEHLTVYGGDVGDDGIIGSREDDEGAHGCYAAEPNISRLQKLKSFAIRQDGKLCDNFTGDSIRYGFLRLLPRLQNFVIEVEEINPDIQEFILGRIPFAKIILATDYCRLCGSVYE